MKKLLTQGKNNLKKLLARTCIGCSCPCADAVCAHCCDSIAKPKHYCRVCGIAMTVPSRDGRCAACIKTPPAFERLDFVGNYDGLLKDWIVGAKLAKQSDAIEALRYIQRRILLNADLSPYRGFSLLPMPTPRARLMQRGFNLPRLFAQALSARADLPIVASRTVKLPFYTQKQALLSQKQRQKHHEKYRIDDKIAKKVVIIDDVVTTGQSVDGLAQQLRSSGVQSVVVWSFCRTQWS